MIPKFRAWDKDLEIMSYTGNNLTLQISKNGIQIAYYDSFHEITNYELSQSTGLLDKNGKEIYEGDILSISKNHSKTDSSVFNDEKVNYEVEFLTYNDFEEYADIEHYGWCVTGSIDGWYTRCTLIDAVKLWDAEIVGNIYQDEHLLEED